MGNPFFLNLKKKNWIRCLEDNPLVSGKKVENCLFTIDVLLNILAGKKLKIRVPQSLSRSRKSSS